MKDRFHNPFDGSRKRSAPQPHALKKDKEKYKPTILWFGEKYYNEFNEIMDKLILEKLKREEE